jgi:hypothetical protein
LAVVGAAGLLAAAYRTHSAFAVVTEGLTLSKTASSDVVSPGDPVTYTYVVQNTGSETLHDLRVVDDAGTPNDASDDFVVGTAATIAPGETLTFTFTLIPTVQLCSVDSDGTHSDAGSLTTETLPNGDIVIRFVQSRDVVDNTYGVNAVGWPNGHTFAQLVGSDHAEFKLRDGAGNVVLYFAADYISQSSAYPSGYGTLGVTGGDGKMFVGSASDVLSVHTSISDDLNQSPAFYGYTKDSPPEPNPAWEYHDSYTVVVSGAKFAANGFGSVEIPYVHNSPAKKAPNAISPVPCDTEVTNVATTNATFTDAGGTVTTVNAAASASVLITTGSGGGGGSTDVGAEGATFSGKVMSVVLTNHGSTAATIQSLSLTWPSSNKSLVKIQNGGATIYDTKTTSTTATFTHWKGHLQDRQIKAGGSITLKLTFEANAATSVSLYSLGIDFGGGTKTLVP